MTSLPANIDTAWLLQGRSFIPAGQTNTVLLLQAHHKEWPKTHYHTGVTLIPEELSDILSLAISKPFDSKLVVESWDPEEAALGAGYLYMVRLSSSKGTVGFLDSNGQTIMVELENSDLLFGFSAECSICSVLVGQGPASEEALDAMLWDLGPEYKDH